MLWGIFDRFLSYLCDLYWVDSRGLVKPPYSKEKERVRAIEWYLFAFYRILFRVFLHNYIDEHRYFVTSTLLTVTTQNKILKKANKHTINQPTNHIATNQPHTRVGSIRDHPFPIRSNYTRYHTQDDGVTHRSTALLVRKIQAKRVSSLKVYTNSQMTKTTAK